MTTNKQYHYFYKITNKVNGHFYYGIHSTKDLNDGYMGSGTRLHYAYKKYGIDSFEKEIIKFFDTRKEASKYEAEVVNEILINDPNCYNVILGGDCLTTLGVAIVKDKNGNRFGVSVSDPRYLSGELVGATKGTTTVKDDNGNIFRVPISDPRYLSGELVHIAKDTLLVKDKNNNYFCVSIDDPRYLSGEFKPFWYGRKHNITTIEKMKKTHQDNKHQQGEKNSQYGTCWIMKDGSNKKIKKDELNSYLQLGWVKGRKCNKTK